MGKFIGGFLIGLIVGTVFAQSLFPDGFGTDIQRWISQVTGG